jgi:MoaA/NifB/PqqE/SkfB family radical SAM enzyme
MSHSTQAAPANAAPAPERARLDFLWLELTNRCNLHCVHCYTESSPQSGDRDKLAAQDYVSTLHEAFALGCRSVQFIGGEPQLNHDFPALLTEATRIGFSCIEVFTNLTFLTEDTLRYAATHGIHFATSVYSDDAATHDAITGVRGSHAKTIHNLRRLIGAGVTTRAGIIRINQDNAATDQTRMPLS